MDTKATAVFGIFQDVFSVQRAAIALRDADYRNAAVSVLFPDSRRTTDFSREKKIKPPQGLTVGSRIGAVVGGAIGWLTGSGAFTIPGLDSFNASDPIVAALAGIGTGGVVGAIVGCLIDLRSREHGARHTRSASAIARSIKNEDHRNSGGFLLCVHCDTDCARRAETILKNTGADAVSFSGNAAA
jgi:hypothetical protein